MTTPTYEYHGPMVRYWDLLRGDTADWPDRAFYLDVIRRSGEPVLDVGCASGRLLLDYSQLGIEVDGVDISPEMLERCARNAHTRGLHPCLHLQDMTELDLPRRYRTILVPSSSIQLLVAPRAAPEAMRRFHAHLHPGGTLAASFMTLWRPGNPLESETIQEACRPEDGALVRRTTWSRFDPWTDLEDTRDTWEVVVDGEVVETEVHERAPATRSYTQAGAVALFEGAGFADIRVHRAFTSEPAGPDDATFTIVATRG
jgi:SAM-dependent methyltransferase